MRIYMGVKIKTHFKGNQNLILPAGKSFFQLLIRDLAKETTSSLVVDFRKLFTVMPIWVFCKKITHILVKLKTNFHP